jgi:hypothetical protein
MTKLRTGATWESVVLNRKQSGDVFYTKTEDKNIQAKAHYYGMKVKTERVVMIEGDLMDPKAVAITKVTIL